MTRTREICAALVVALLVIAGVAVATNTAGAVTAASQLAVSTPSNTVATTAFATQPKVTFQDSSGNTVSTTASVSLSIKAGTGTAGATLTCPAQAAVAGVATFTGCKIDKVGTGYQLVATSGSLTGTSADFNITVGTATQVAFTHQPASITAGSAFATAPTLAVEDAGGNVVTSNTDAVGLTVVPAPGAGPISCSGGETSSGANQSPGYKVTAIAGVAAFPSCTISKALTSTTYTLVAEATDGTSAGTFEVVSAPFSVSAGAAAQLAFVTSPTGARGGSAFSTQPVVAVEDFAGNVVTTRTDTIALSRKSGTGSAGSTLTCPAATAVAGVATFAGCSIDLTGAGYVLNGTSGTLSGVSSAFDVSAGSVAHLAFTSPPGNTTGGVAIGGTPAVAVTDAGGAAVSGSVRLSLTGGPSGATLSCPTNPASAGTGSAVFTGCTVDKAGTYQLVATDPDATSITATSSAFTVAAGAAAQLAFTAAPGAATGGTQFVTQPTVTVEDLGGNPVAVAGDTVHLALATGTGTAGARLTCGASSNTISTSTGVAAFSGCAVDRTGSGYRLTASADGLIVTGPAFDVTAGGAAKLAFTAAPTAGIVASPFGSQPQVSVEDAGGNPVGSTGVVVTLAASGPGSLSCVANPVTTAGGVATFTGCQVSAAGSYTVSASGGGLAGTTSAAFTVSGGTPLGAAPLAEPVGQTFGGLMYARNTTSTVDDVNSATGALELSVSDLNIAGIGEPFALTREYNSLDTSGGAFGVGWSSIFDAGVVVAGNGLTALVRGEDGQQLIYSSTGNGAWNAPPGARASLVCAGATCTVTRFDGVVWHSRGGHIQDYLAATGQGLHFTYNGTTLTGVTVALATSTLNVGVTTNGSGQVTAVTTPTRSLGYAYSGSTLVSFTDAAGRTSRYAYSTGLAQEIDPLGQVRLQATYSSGRVAAATGMGGPTHFADTYSWNAATQTSTRTASLVANGAAALGSYRDQYKSNNLISQQQPDGATTSYSYDAQRNMIEIQDPLGRIQLMSYNTTGDLISQTVQYTATASAITRFAYDTSHRATASTDANGNTTTFQYTGANLTQTTPPGLATGVTKYLYNSLGERTEADSPTGIETFSYDAAGNQAGFQLLDLHRATLNGLGPITTYDEAGDRLVAADARGHNSDGTTNAAYRTTNTYDADGRLLTTTSPGPQTTTNVYTAAGDVQSTTLPGSPTTTFGWNEATLTRTAATSAGTTTSTYDASGDLLTQVDAGGRTTSYGYDTTGRQISKTDTANITTAYTFDLDSNVLTSTDTVGHTATFSYDPQNRPVRSVVNGVTTTAAYDPAGNLVAQTDGSARPTSYTFTNHERIATVKNAAGTTTYSYDASDNVISTKDGNGHFTLTAYNGAGQKVASTVNGHTTTYTYDVANNLTVVTDPDGRVSTYALNAQDLRTGITYTQPGQATIAVTQQYNAAGQRTAMTDPATGTHAYSYDGSGNMTSATNNGDVYTYDYSHPGSVVETYPDGTRTSTTYDDSHNVMSVQAPGVNVSYLRNAARQITGIAYSNGILETQAYNQSGQLISQALSCAGTTQATLTYAYDAAGTPLAAQTTLGTAVSTTSYGYDTSGRLAAQSTGTGTAATPTTPDLSPTCTSGTMTTSAAPQGNDGSQGTTVTAPASANQPATVPGLTSNGTSANPISYDAVGNRTAANGTTYTYDAADEVTSQTGTASATWQYDKAGDVIATGSTTYGYDAADRLARVTTPTSTITYTYDGDGNRVSRVVTGSGAGTTLYSWDTSGKLPLLALERDASKALIRRYIYGAAPLAMQTPAGTFYFHTDQNGDVTQLSDSTGSIVESYSYDGFGNVTATKVGTRPAPVNPIMFQSQYLDSTTGLYDMRARNYDPATGRFTQRDPLPPQVGTPVVSAYIYSGDQPTTSADPSGQSAADTVANGAFHGHSTESANDVNDARYGVIATSAIGLRAGIAIAKYAGYIEEGAGKSLQDVGGKVLGVIGIGLSIYTTVEDCETGPVAACVGDTVGVAISIACLALTEGVGAIACGIAGAALSYVITAYGPQIVQGLADLGEYEIEGATIAINAIADGYAIAGTALVGAYGTASAAIVGAYNTTLASINSTFGGSGPIATGFEKAGTAISSGFNSAVSALEQAGYTAAQMATVLANTFRQGVDTVVNELANLAYDVDGVAKALGSVFSEGAAVAAAELKKFLYSVNQIGSALSSAFNEVAADAALILKNLSYTVNQIAGALVGVYHEIDTGLATILQGLSYAIDDISGALKSALAETDAALVSALQTVSYTLTQIASTLHDIYNEADTAVATLYKGLSIGATAIATALEGAFADVDSAVATILLNLNVAFNDVATALENGFGEAASAVASVLKDVGTALNIANLASQISSMLGTVFGEAVGDIESLLGDIGFTSSTISAIGGAFTSFGDDVASGFESAFSWL